MIGQIKILKQDIMNKLSFYINDKNIDEFISQLKTNVKIEFNIETQEKGYKMFQSEILLINELKSKFTGFGRSDFESLFTAFKNLIEFLIQDEKNILPIKNCFEKNDQHLQKENIFENNISTNYENFTTNYKLVPSENHKNQTIKVIQKTEFNIIEDTNKKLEFSEKESIKCSNQESTDQTLKSLRDLDLEIKPYSLKDENTILKKDLEEKNLIILEMEKLIIDILGYNKKIIDYFEIESNPESIPNYFKCPISWEKMDNPVISNEGHSYEKWAIEKWLSKKNISPITGLELTDRNLIYNYTLKSSIDDFQKKQQRMKKVKIDFQKFITKSEYDLNDLKKYFQKSK